MKTLRDIRIGDAIYIFSLTKKLYRFVITNIDIHDDTTQFYYGNDVWEYLLFRNSELDNLPSHVFLNVEDLIKYLNENV